MLRRFPALVFVLIAAAATVASSAAQSAETAQVLVSRQLAERKQLHVGDTIRLSAELSGAGAKPFRVAGVYEPTPDPMRFAQQTLEARLHLPDLLALSAKTAKPDGGPVDAVTSINVALANAADADRFAHDVAARLPGLVARPIAAPDQRTSTFLVIERFHLAIAIVTVIGSAVFLLALMVMLVDERRGTIGTLRLIGFTRRRILLQIFAEGALIAVVGTAAGILFALATQGLFNRFFQWRYDTTLVFLRITPRVAIQSVLLAVPIGIAASLVASLSLVRQQLLTLIRR